MPTAGQATVSLVSLLCFLRSAFKDFNDEVFWSVGAHDHPEQLSSASEIWVWSAGKDASMDAGMDAGMDASMDASRQAQYDGGKMQ